MRPSVQGTHGGWCTSGAMSLKSSSLALMSSSLFMNRCQASSCLGAGGSCCGEDLLLCTLWGLLGKAGTAADAL